MKKILYTLLIIVLLNQLYMIIGFSEIYFNQNKILKIEHVGEGEDTYKVKIGFRSFNLTETKTSFMLANFPSYPMGDGYFYFRNVLGYKIKFDKINEKNYQLIGLYQSHFLNTNCKVTFNLKLKTINTLEGATILYTIEKMKFEDFKLEDYMSGYTKL